MATTTALPHVFPLSESFYMQRNQLLQPTVYRLDNKLSIHLPPLKSLNLGFQDNTSKTFDPHSCFIPITYNLKSRHQLLPHKEDVKDNVKDNVQTCLEATKQSNQQIKNHQPPQLASDDMDTDISSLESSQDVAHIIDTLSVTIETPVTDRDEELGDDDELAIQNLLDIKKRCANCGTGSTCQWRKGWFNIDSQRNVQLCNPCGLKYQKGQFCYYCDYIYYKDTQLAGWLSCVACTQRVHIECHTSSLDDKSRINFNPRNFRCAGCTPVNKKYHV